MLKSVRRWLFGPPALPAWGALQAWCAQQSLLLRPTPQRDGFVIERPGGEPGWRIEWGPSRRTYLGSHELRLRGETGLDLALHALLIPRPLMTVLERALYSQITDSVQTRLDDDTPEEVRWLAMSTKLSAAQMGALHPAYGAVCNVPEWMAAWLAGPLQAALPAASMTAPPHAIGAAPLAIVLQRGGMALRLGTPAPGSEMLDLGQLSAALALFELALAETRRMAGTPLP